MGVEAHFNCSAEFFLCVTKAAKGTTRRSQSSDGPGKEHARQREQWVTSIPHFTLVSWNDQEAKSAVFSSAFFISECIIHTSISAIVIFLLLPLLPNPSTFRFSVSLLVIQ